VTKITIEPPYAEASQSHIQLSSGVAIFNKFQLSDDLVTLLGVKVIRPYSLVGTTKPFKYVLHTGWNFAYGLLPVVLTVSVLISTESIITLPVKSMPPSGR
jgi:hypothetical protein